MASRKRALFEPTDDLQHLQFQLDGPEQRRWASCTNQNSPSPPHTPLLANTPAQLLRFLVESTCYAA
jgi:hypothetical protein